MELASGLSFPQIKRHRVVGNADHPVFVSSAELRPREIVGEDGFVGPAPLGQRFGTPLAQAHAVAVAFCRDEEAAVLIGTGRRDAWGGGNARGGGGADNGPRARRRAVPETVWPQTGREAA